MSLSVVIPNYNHARFLPKALDAIVSQSLPPLEVIIVDDASTDESVMIIESYQKKYSFIHLYKNERNLGAVATLNKAVDLSQGKYLACCASDDEILPGFFEESVTLLEKHPQAAFCSSQYCTFYDESEQMKIQRVKLKSVLTPNEFCKQLQFNDIRIGGQNAIFHREKLKAAGKFLPELSFLCDWFLIAVLGLRHGLCTIDKPLTKLRIHQKSFSQNGIQNKKNLNEILTTLAGLLEEPRFADVKDSFLKSGLVYQLGLYFDPLYLQKKHRKFMTPAWAFHTGIDWLKNCKHRLTCRS